MPGEQDLEGVVREAFSRTREYVWQEVDIVPLTLWNESILRYCFCRSVANDDTEVKQFIECDRIDLVVHHQYPSAPEIKDLRTVHASANERISRLRSQS